MPKVSVNHATSLNPEDTFVKIKEFFQTDETLQKIDPNLKLVFNDSTKTGDAKSKQFSAQFSVKGAGSGSQVAVTIDLPLLLTPFKGKVQETLERKLKKYLV